MNKKAKQLRKLRNKHFPPKLEFGCEIEKDGKIYKFHSKNNKGEMEGFAGLYDGDNEVIVVYGNEKILGKPTSWGDVLRMIASNPVYISLRYGTLVINENTDIEIIIDLTLPPEEQDEEVLDKLISLIK